MPIHNASDDLNLCLESVHRTTPTAAEVILIDDASDEAAVREVIAHWSAQGGSRWRVRRNQHNLGFVASANLGMKILTADVVLLNSDTVVTPGWLQGLGACLASDPDIATATPWTNNGEIASFPELCKNNAFPVNPDALAAVISVSGGRQYPELPTAVGFCMAISRAAIDRLGYFDEHAFGLGYGEENDFSARAGAAGMKNVLCSDVYVAHRGGRSFEPRGLRPDDESMRRLLEKHPHYLKSVMDFIARDPLARLRSGLLAELRTRGVALG